MTDRTPQDDPAATKTSQPTRDPSLAEAPEVRHTPLWRKILSVVLTLAVIVIVFGFVIPKLADYRKVLDIIGDITALEWIALGVFTAIFLVAYVFVLMAVLPSLRFREGFVTQTAGTAITNSVPAGGALAFALNYTMLMSWGFTAEAVTAGLMAAGVWDQLARLALPSIAAAIVASETLRHIDTPHIAARATHIAHIDDAVTVTIEQRNVSWNTVC